MAYLSVISRLNEEQTAILEDIHSVEESISRLGRALEERKADLVKYQNQLKEVENAIEVLSMQE